MRSRDRPASSRCNTQSASCRGASSCRELAIARVFDETPDVKTFRLVSPSGGALPFAHVAGQYLTSHETWRTKRGDMDAPASFYIE